MKMGFILSFNPNDAPRLIQMSYVLKCRTTIYRYVSLKCTTTITQKLFYNNLLKRSHVIFWNNLNRTFLVHIIYILIRIF